MSPKGIKNRGFASMSPEKRKAAQRKGGKLAQSDGTGFRYTKGSDTAKEAGRKGGIASAVARREREAQKKEQS